MRRGLLQGIALLRWLAWLMLAATLVLAREQLARPWLAIGLAAVALVVTVFVTARSRRDPLAALAPVVAVAEVAVGACVALCDGWAYRPGHGFAVALTLGGAWPLAGVLTAGVLFGATGGAAAGLAIGMARAGGQAANGLLSGHVSAAEVISLITTTALYSIAGGVIGRVAVLLDRAETEISIARARDEIARTLHDGVLQTLAIVERSTENPELARLAREQERSLRAFLVQPTARDGGRRPADAASCAATLHQAANKFEAAYGAQARVIVADDVDDMPPDELAALSGAVGEALTNAGKHGGARHVTVYVEPAGEKGIFCSVKDDGKGFDQRAQPEGFGLTQSVRARMAELGGTVEVESTPGGGTEVRLWTRRDGHG
jgi:signal transduction histidine kinase